ncbi:MAG TPA: 2-oxo-4-hydroxy-4-carboxy-5-ureidoimidazoline decarboxylase [Pseudonocardiaceae bacterium]|nr:2-oxo-4-hydroxy-4-carboxy-5-ureidoimidazoline decarboxylase [Pseudonocardiaceae bacterium]
MNRLPRDSLTDLLGQCVAVGRWARELADSRPYPGVAELLARADEVSASLTDTELAQALADHPRIGGRTAAGSRSAAEQSGVDADRLGARLAEANAAYEARFGHIYLVCAAGRTGDELLADLTDRMANDPATELGVVRRELGRIAHLRLAGLVTA